MKNKRLTFDQRHAEVAAISRDRGFRMDANETIFFTRQLEQIETRLFSVKYPDGHGVEMVPLLTNIDPGAQSYTYRALDYTGQAKRSSNYAEDAPRADLIGLEVNTKLHSYRDAYGYSIQDLRAAAKVNLPLEDKLAMAARTILMRQLDINIWLGDTDVAITGLANNALVSLVTPITGTWSSATAAQILADLQKLVSAAPIASSGIERPDTVAVAVSTYEILATTFIGNALQRTVLDLFKQANPQIKKVAASFRLETANAGGNGPRAIAYTNDPEKIEALVPVEFEQFPPIAKNMSFDIQCHGRFGGVAVRYPGSVKYMDGI
jgi:hypothetical protein